MNPELKRILLVDDSPRDTEMALNALAQNNLANEVVALRDGVETLDYLYRRGPFADRAAGQPAVVLLDLVNSYQLGVNAYIVKPVKFHEFIEAVKLVGAFWAVVNEPPPGSVSSGRGKT